MRFIVDTSVWSLALRRSRPQHSPSVLKLKILVDAGEEILLLGVILTELLRGFRLKDQGARLKKALEPFPLLEPTRDDYAFAAEIHDECRSKGIQTSTIDSIIAAASIRHRAWLLTEDRDFSKMASVVALKLA